MPKPFGWTSALVIAVEKEKRAMSSILTQINAFGEK